MVQLQERLYPISKQTFNMSLDKSILFPLANHGQWEVPNTQAKKPKRLSKNPGSLLEVLFKELCTRVTYS